jgi:uncharacterized protein
MNAKIKIEVAYTGLKAQSIRALNMSPRCTIREAIILSGILDDFPELGTEIDALEGRVGIFGANMPLATQLMDGDRVEIYRALFQDPKAARRLRALTQRKLKKSSNAPKNS